MSIVFIFKAVNGTIDFQSDANRARFKDALKKYEGKEFRIELLKMNRSVNQLRYYWSYIEIISRETGDDANSLHEFFKMTLLPPKLVKVMRREVKMVTSTSELSKQAMSDYMDRICALTNVPLPNILDYKRYINSAPLK